ncbi:cytosolic phospholipase A2 gamma [Aythya fuligula]|uniref:Cytosolic phospholipase A2 gamma n=1 Tax=Aythya fuligula TaxID=219594 RepID=A0A6J3E962_AYTFU|nr:cytosolic phospholipase A2 gamma [Aythya fuligula]
MREDNEVRVSSDLSEGEIKATQNRRERVKTCLHELLDVHFEEDNVPNIVVLGSGGGLRAMIALLGTLVELKNQNILDAVMYLCGVSGSTCYNSPYLQVNDDEESRKVTTSQENVENFWVPYYSEEPYVVSAVIPNILRLGGYDAIQNDLDRLDRCMSMLYTDWKWSEKLSLEENLIKILTVDSWDFWKAIDYLEESSEDENYSLTDVWACVVYTILHQFDEKELTDYKNASESGINPYPIYAAVDKEKLSEAGASSPGTWFEFTPHEAGYTALGAFVSTENFGSKFEKGTLMEKNKKKTICYMQGLWGSALGSMEEILKAILAGLWSIFRILTKTTKCTLKWRWGTTNNFLYKCPNIQSSHLFENKTISLIDAGLAINSAYPLVLKKQRQTDLILSFDFSSGDPFETVKKAADYCQKNDIPFPKIEKQKMDKESPSDCYVFRGDKSCPTVIHFPLFNKVNCSDKIEEYRSKFCTRNMSYSETNIKDLLAKAKLNVSNNSKKILQEIQLLLSSSHTNKF